MAWLETISETAMPAPWRLACRRTNQLPISASGASSTRLGTCSVPSVQGSVSRGRSVTHPLWTAPLATDTHAAARRGGSAVALVDQSQPGQSQEIVDGFDRRGKRHDRTGEPAGGDRLRLGPELGAQAVDDRVDLAGGAVDDAGADGVDCGLADQRAGRGDVDLGQGGGALGERLERDLDAGRDDPAEVLAVGGDGVVGDGGAEVDDDAGSAEAGVRGDGVDEPVGTDLAGVVVADRHGGLDAGPDDEHLVAEVALDHGAPFGAEDGHGGGDDRGVDVGHRDVAQLEQVAQRGAELVGGGLADGGEAPVLAQLALAEGPEVGLGVSDVDGQQHERGRLSRTCRVAPGRLAPARSPLPRSGHTPFGAQAGRAERSTQAHLAAYMLVVSIERDELR